ncbi:hypothetical protein P261_02579 [Lachnospiraceae bacterium TWA4]|nr:hypothetical protein P261_02579 [Lachnospiraceae bacterium TWA4]
MDDKKLFEAMTDIDDTYIENAYDFKKEGRIIKLFKCSRNIAVAAVVAVVLVGTTAYGAAKIIKQMHITEYTSLSDLKKEKKIKEDEMISVTDETVDDTSYKEGVSSECWLDRVCSNKSDIVKNTKPDSWSRMYEERRENLVLYDYTDLQVAMNDYQIPLNLSYIQEHYPQRFAEYGVYIEYTDSSKKEMKQAMFFDTYRTSDGQCVGIEYEYRKDNENMPSYEFHEGNKSSSYYTTNDGVEVFLTKKKGSEGGTVIFGTVYGEHCNIYLKMYNLENQEIQKICNSLNLSKVLFS